MRMFAGPNGSGKSTLKTVLREDLIGYYINPDEIENQLRLGGLDLQNYGLVVTIEQVQKFFKQSLFLYKAGLGAIGEKLRLESGKLKIEVRYLNSYCASVLADFIRQELINVCASFTFETVMSSSDKVDLLKYARNKGYRTYLYYICTDDPAINVLRVHNRVAGGGHSVPVDKIISRYKRSLDLLSEAIRHSNRAYVFDNSVQAGEKIWIAEITNGTKIEMKSTILPSWFKHSVLEKMSPAGRSTDSSKQPPT